MLTVFLFPPMSGPVLATAVMQTLRDPREFLQKKVRECDKEREVQWAQP